MVSEGPRHDERTFCLIFWGAEWGSEDVDSNRLQMFFVGPGQHLQHRLWMLREIGQQIGEGLVPVASMRPGRLHKIWYQRAKIW